MGLLCSHHLNNGGKQKSNDPEKDGKLQKQHCERSSKGPVQVLHNESGKRKVVVEQILIVRSFPQEKRPPPVVVFLPKG